MEAELLLRRTHMETAQYERFLQDKGVLGWGGNAYAARPAPKADDAQKKKDEATTAAAAAEAEAEAEAAPAAAADTPAAAEAPADGEAAKPAAKPKPKAKKSKASLAAAKKKRAAKAAEAVAAATEANPLFHACRLMYTRRGRGVMVHGEHASALNDLLEDMGEQPQVRLRSSGIFPVCVQCNFPNLSSLSYRLLLLALSVSTTPLPLLKSCRKSSTGRVPWSTCG
jgi:hypothetical protein